MAKLEAAKAGKCKVAVAPVLKKGKTRTVSEKEKSKEAEIPVPVVRETTETIPVEEPVEEIPVGIPVDPVSSVAKKRKVDAKTIFTEEEFSEISSSLGDGFISSFNSKTAPVLEGYEPHELAQKCVHSALLTLGGISGLGHGLSIWKSRMETALKTVEQVKQDLCTAQSKLAAAQGDLEAERNTSSNLRSILETAKNECAQAKADASTSELMMQGFQKECATLKEKVKELEEAVSNQDESTAMYYTAVTRIDMIRASESDRQKWNLEDELESFKAVFPDMPVPGEETGEDDDIAEAGPSGDDQGAGGSA